MTETTNNRMELTALIKALEHIEIGPPVRVFADSEYVIKGLTVWSRNWVRNGWKTATGNPVINQDLWEHALMLYKLHSVKFEWVNPHSWIHIDANVGGKIQRWRVEGGAPSALLRRGWNRNSLPAGTDIIVDAFRARDGDTRGSAAEIRFPNGRELSLGNPTTEAVAAAAARAKGN